jgi:hypothetical protein
MLPHPRRDKSFSRGHVIVLSFGIAGWQTADLQEQQVEYLELVDHCVQGGLVRERVAEQRLGPSVENAS